MPSRAARSSSSTLAREVPFDASQLDTRIAMAPDERAELSFMSWNKLAGELTLAGARARAELT